MTAARSMHPLYLAAAADPGPPWYILLGGALLTAIGGAGSWALIQARLARKDVVHDQGVKDDATVRVAEITARASAESEYFKQLNKFREETQVELREVRRKAEDDRRTLNHEIRNLRNEVTLVREVYHQLYSMMTMLVVQYRILRARHKKIEKENFDETEFPDFDITIFDPKLLFKPSQPALDPSALTTVTVEQDGRKLTGKIEAPNA